MHIGNVEWASKEKSHQAAVCGECQGIPCVYTLVDYPAVVFRVRMCSHHRTTEFDSIHQGHTV